MKSFKQFIKEELNSSQKNTVRRWTNTYYGSDSDVQSPKAVQISGHVIPPGHHHIIIPISNPRTREAVESHLNSNGIEIHDYENGKAQDKYGRSVNIGKALQKTKAPQDLIDKYASTNKSDLGKYEIIISRHPFHVAEGSTGKKWSSCAKLTKSGDNLSMAAKKMPDEIREGTHVAYLVPKSSSSKPMDLQERIDKAVGRVYIKPHVSESGHTVIRPENKIYHSLKNKPEEFYDAVNDFSEQHFPMHDGELYRKHDDVYDDDNNTLKFNMNNKNIKKIWNKLDYRGKQVLTSDPKLHPKTLDFLTDMLINSNEVDDHMHLSTIAARYNLHKKVIDKLMNTPKLGNKSELAYNHNLTSDHIHKILDDHLEQDKSLSKIFADKYSHNKNLYSHSSYHNMRALANRKSFNNDHLKKMLQSNNAQLHKSLLWSAPHLFKDEDLDFVENKFKDYKPKGYNDDVMDELKKHRNVKTETSFV
jgi:hypothetical protein